MITELESLLATMVAPARVTTASAAALAREQYGLEARAERLTGERDENFKLSTLTGAEYVLKVANPAEEAAVGELLTAALRHLEREDSGIACPRVLPARSGALQVRLVDAGGAERRACVLTYLPGKLLGSAGRSQRQRAECGRIAGRLSRSLRSFSHPGAHRTLIWDLRHVGQVLRLLEQLPHCNYRSRVAEPLAQIVQRLEAGWRALRQQVVHNDLNPFNILVDPADEARVTGVIDFGDLTYTALVADVAVTAAELIPAECGPGGGLARAAVRDVASAYSECVPLLEIEQALLPTLVAARLITNVVVQDWHLHHNPGGGHYAPLAPEFVRTRLAIAAELLHEEITL